MEQEHSEHGQHQHHETAHHEQGSKSGKRLNIWKIATLVLALAIVVFLAIKLIGPGELSSTEAASKTVTFVNDNLLQNQATAKLTAVTEAGDLYNVKLNINGQLIDGYTTKDGKLFFPQAINLDEVADTTETPAAAAPPEVPKTDKPKVELFVMSHCPYGTQAEKALLPVIETLGTKADIAIKFVDYAMHGEKEVLEQMNQVCIEEEQNAKYIDYLTCFLAEGDGEGCLTSTGVDQQKLTACVKELDTKYKITASLADETTWSGGRYPPFAVYETEGTEYGVQGSPTLVINGEVVSVARSPSAYLAAVCAAFNTAPEECATELSATAAAPGFGFEAATGAATTASCG